MVNKNWVEIVTMIGCPNNCWYCPQNKLLNVYKGKKQMSFEDFKYYLSFIPKERAIHFSGFSESFYHPDIKKFLMHAFNEGYRIVVYSTFEGLDDFSGLEGLVLEELHVHRYPSGNERVISKRLEDFLSIVKSKCVTNDYIRFPENRAGNVECIKSIDRVVGQIFCGRLFGNVLLPSGLVVLCCSDFGLEIPLGFIWDKKGIDEAREKFVKKMMEEDSNILCRYCVYANKRK